MASWVCWHVAPLRGRVVARCPLRLTRYLPHLSACAHALTHTLPGAQGLHKHPHTKAHTPAPAPAPAFPALCVCLPVSLCPCVPVCLSVCVPLCPQVSRHMVLSRADLEQWRDEPEEFAHTHGSGSWQVRACVGGWVGVCGMGGWMWVYQHGVSISQREGQTLDCVFRG